MRLTFWMSVSTILYWSGMWVTMWVMLSSVVRTRVGPNTMARFLGSIWWREAFYTAALRRRPAGDAPRRRYLVLLAVFSHGFQVSREELQSLVMMVGQLVELEAQGAGL